MQIDDLGGSPVKPLLDVRNLQVDFPIRGGFGRKSVFHAVQGVDLRIAPGETLGLAGESGSGKTTLGYAILGHHAASGGHVIFDGTDVTNLRGNARKPFRREMQMIFQDPYGSLNPRMKVEDIVGEPLLVHDEVSNHDELRVRVSGLLEMCGLPPDVGSRYPHAFSGGQRQRLGVARALALQPRLIVADEPTSALDVSIQAQIVNLLQDIQAELEVAYLFISHNLAVLRHACHRIAIMYKGRIVEVAPTDEIFEHPQHPYTQALLRSLPVPDPDVKWLDDTGQAVPDADDADSTTGCSFASRCPQAEARCMSSMPELQEVRRDHYAACWPAQDRAGAKVRQRTYVAQERND